MIKDGGMEIMIDSPTCGIDTSRKTYSSPMSHDEFLGARSENRRTYLSAEDRDKMMESFKIYVDHIVNYEITEAIKHFDREAFNVTIKIKSFLKEYCYNHNDERLLVASGLIMEAFLKDYIDKLRNKGWTIIYQPNRAFTGDPFFHMQFQ